MSASWPRNWEAWPLASVGDWSGGGTPTSSEVAYWDGDVPWITPKDMKALRLASSQDKITPAAVESSAAKMIDAGAVLFVTRSGILAHSFPVATTSVAATINQDLKAITPVEVIDPEYLAWALRAFERTILRSCSKHGTTVHSIEMPELKRLEVPVAPLNEQRRIVAKIEELFSELDKGVESLTTAREQLKAYRQSVLKHAFEGKLTGRWRERQRNLLGGDGLLEFLRAARATQATRLGLSKPSPVTPLSADVLEALPEIPSEWIWEKLGWLTCGVGHGTSAKSAKSGRVPVVRMGNIQNGVIDWSDLVYTDDDAEIEKYALCSGDVLFNRTNSPELVGKTAIYRGERPAIFAGYLIRLNHAEDIVDGDYLNFYLNSGIAKTFGNSVKTDGVNQSNINGEKLQAYPFPYCSLAEQREVVRLLKEKLSLCDSLLADLEAQHYRADALRQATLRKAFSGQLVRQNPSDEPASVLLERIRARQGEGGAKQRRNGKNGTKEAA